MTKISDQNCDSIGLIHINIILLCQMVFDFPPSFIIHVPAGSSPQVFGGLSIGPHRLKVVPFIEECGRSRYPAHIRFTVQPE